MRTPQSGHTGDIPPATPKKRRGITALILVSGAIILALGVTAAWTMHRHNNTSASQGGSLAAASLRPPSAGVAGCLELLRKTTSDKPGLAEVISSLVQQARTTGQQGALTDAELMLVSYRDREGEIDDVVIQLYHARTGGRVSVFNPDGVARARLGDEMFDSAQRLMSMMYYEVTYIGKESEVWRRQRALQEMLNADVTLLREQTVEPLHVVAILPRAAEYLPRSLNARVRSVVVDAELRFNEWRSRVTFVADNGETAIQIGNTVAAWRALAASLAEKYAAHGSGRSLHDALQSISVQVNGDLVETFGAMPAVTIVQVANTLGGHGGFCGNTSRAATFNSTSISKNRFIWFNAHARATTLGGNCRAELQFDNQTITSSQFNLTVPDGVIFFNPGVTTESTGFPSTRWETTVGCQDTNKWIFISGVAYKAPSNLPGGLNVTWAGRFTGTTGMNVQWRWAAAVYTQFSTNYDTLDVDAMEGGVNGTDPVGTPEAYKNRVTGGALGSGAPNYTGTPTPAVAVGICQ